MSSSITIERNWYLNGALTNVTTAKLSDPTGSFGIRRSDTQAVAVVDGTDMTNPSTGLYRYEFTPIPDVPYEAWVEFVYNGVEYHFKHDLPATPAIVVGQNSTYTDDELKDCVAAYLGFKPDYSALTNAREIELCDQSVAMGKSILLNPDVLEGEFRVHQWSWLRQWIQFNTVVEQANYLLPADFGGLDGLLIIAEEDGYQGRHLQSRPLNHGLQTYQSASRPTHSSVNAVPTSSNTDVKQQWELWLYPKPDKVYQISGRYWVTPDYSEFGGSPHKETLKAACLAAAESSVNDNRGEKWDMYMRRLRASVQYDRQNAAVDKLGTMVDANLEVGRYRRSGYGVARRAAFYGPGFGPTVIPQTDWE